MKKELNYYEEIGNWDFSKIKYEIEKTSDWDFYKEIEKYSNENSKCLDLGTGGGEKVIKYYPKVKEIIATDFSKNMIKTANANLKKENNIKNSIKFLQMDSLNMIFPNESFNLVSARHTVINAKQIYSVLSNNGVLIIEGIDKNDCIELKEMFGRGQAYNDDINIADKDYKEIKEAGFSKIIRKEIIEYEYYKTKKDLLALLLKTPILDDFSKIKYNENLNKKEIEKGILNKYIKQYKKDKGILLKRVLYGIIAIK